MCRTERCHRGREGGSGSGTSTPQRSQVGPRDSTGEGRLLPGGQAKLAPLIAAGSKGGDHRRVAWGLNTEEKLNSKGLGKADQDYLDEVKQQL